MLCEALGMQTDEGRFKRDPVAWCGARTLEAEVGVPLRLRQGRPGLHSETLP